jgi:hypothetical protein
MNYLQNTVLVRSATRNSLAYNIVSRIHYNSDTLIPSHRFNNNRRKKRSYFTNTETMKKDDPYATLGIQWGATTMEIKEAFRTKARELHPDVNKEDSAELALKKFQLVQKAYSKLMDVKGAPHRDDLMDEWSFSVWRNSDIIAQERTDVAGMARKRPIKPAEASKPKSQWGIASIGHPDGGGSQSRRRNEYLGGGYDDGRRRKSIPKKEYKQWDPDSVKVKGVTTQIKK